MFKKACLLASFVALPSAATIVEFETSQGNFQINLYDESVPTTVNNFLTYINENDYTNTLVHRSIEGFVIQGGGFTFEGELPLSPIETRATIDNEAVWSNVQGTVSMAKIGGQPNSATSQWFINMEDNSSSLDATEEGYAVFGQVVSGWDVVTGINEIATCNTSTMNDIPMPRDEGVLCSELASVGQENFVTIYSVTIVDSTVDTTEGLTMVENTLIDTPAPSPEPSEPNSGGSSGGSFAWLTLIGLGLLGRFRKLA